MNVPLDNLYNYLDGLVDRDKIIYRWIPHGSRNLNDLHPLQPFAAPHPKYFETPAIIAHDQEPLIFDFYTQQEVFEFYSQQVLKYLNLRIPDRDFEFVKNLGLRAASGSVYRPILLHSERNSSELEKFQSANYFDAYYWSHALISRDWFRYAKVDPMLHWSNKNFTTLFLLYNRAYGGTREYRIKLAEQLVCCDLLRDTKTTFPRFDNGIHYNDHNWKNQNYCPSVKNLENHFIPSYAASHYSADYSSADYNQCAIDVVAETVFDSQTIHITEKTLRPMACGKPFILFAGPGALNYLKSYGFFTFDGLIDETYDQIQDPMSRMNAIISEMTRLSQLPRHELCELINETHYIASKNKKHFFSDEFFETIIKEYTTNINRALDQTLNYGPEKEIVQRYQIMFSLDDSYKNAKNTLFAESFVKSIQQLADRYGI